MDLLARALQRAGSSTSAAVRQGDALFTYTQLLRSAATLHDDFAPSMRQTLNKDHAPRVGCIVEPGPLYVMSLWSAWLSGSIFVPLAPTHPTSLLEYEADDARLSMPQLHKRSRRRVQLLTEQKHLERAHAVASKHSVPLHVIDDALNTDDVHGPLPIDPSTVARLRDDNLDSGSLILYTSGTTGKPKGVLHTHRSLAAQMDALSTAWRWRSSDAILHTLPLHHIHGLVNALMCAHYNGAVVDFAPFSGRAVWARLCQRDANVFMGVPSMYAHLLATYDAFPEEKRAACREAAAALRLAVCGSAACPQPIMRAWQGLSGEYLLERYGMTETGMVLSNPYAGTRQPGSVGTPLPGMEVRLVRPAPEVPTADAGPAAERAASGDSASTSEPAAAPTRRLALDEDEETEILQQDRDARAAAAAAAAARPWRRLGRAGDAAPEAAPADPAEGAARSANGGSIANDGLDEERAGELAVRGPSLFKEYWRRPKETAAAFDADGYFLTGDTGDTVQVDGGTYYRILGRTSVDIIKCGGFKLSALRIENVLLAHPAISEVAALGLPDDVYGEVVAVVVALKEGQRLGLAELIGWGTDELTLHELPRDLKIVDRLERNAMGKVNKRELRRLFTGGVA